MIGITVISILEIKELQSESLSKLLKDILLVRGKARVKPGRD